LTDGEKGYDDIPWCYYNIFFVHHDKYRMKVARPVQVSDKYWSKKYNRDAADPTLYTITAKDGTTNTGLRNTTEMPQIQLFTQSPLKTEQLMDQDFSHLLKRKK